MKWEGDRQSDNIEDRRDDGDGGGGGGGLPFIGGRGIGLGTIAIAVIAGLVFHVNPLAILGLVSGAGGGAPVQTQQAPNRSTRPHDPAEEQLVAFVRTVLADTEDVWTTLFQAEGATYRKPVLVMFRGSTRTGCGQGQAAMGPFYCPADEKVYIDLGFYDTLRTRLGSPGDFAQAYVIAHEVGHHVQKLMGISAKVDAARRGSSEARANALSVRLELQADCFSGVWANHANQMKQVLQPGDIDEALNAASHIGDDALQRQARGTVVPETFTHGTSAQRVHWFRQGFDSGDIHQCDTFQARSL